MANVSEQLRGIKIYNRILLRRLLYIIISRIIRVNIENKGNQQYDKFTGATPAFLNRMNAFIQNLG